MLRVVWAGILACQRELTPVELHVINAAASAANFERDFVSRANLDIRNGVRRPRLVVARRLPSRTLTRAVNKQRQLRGLGPCVSMADIHVVAPTVPGEWLGKARSDAAGASLR